MQYRIYHFKPNCAIPEMTVLSVQLFSKYRFILLPYYLETILLYARSSIFIDGKLEYDDIDINSISDTPQSTSGTTSQGQFMSCCLPITNLQSPNVLFVSRMTGSAPCSMQCLPSRRFQKPLFGCKFLEPSMRWHQSWNIKRQEPTKECLLIN